LTNEDTQLLFEINRVAIKQWFKDILVWNSWGR